MYDAVQERIKAYERRLEEELEAQACEELRERDLPEHPSPAKEKSLRSRGEQAGRTTLYRFAAFDLTRIDGIGVGASRTILTEVGLDLTAFPSEKHFVSWLRLAPRAAISGASLCQGRSGPMAREPRAWPPCCAWPPSRCKRPSRLSAPRSGARRGTKACRSPYSALD